MNVSRNIVGQLVMAAIPMKTGNTDKEGIAVPTGGVHPAGGRERGFRP